MLVADILGSEVATFVFAVGIFLSMLLMIEIGRRYGLAQRTSGNDIGGVGAIEGAVFGLLGLLLAFTFSGAASRFDARRHLVIDEANAIGTAYLRLDLLPPDLRPRMQEAVRRYTDSRLEVYRRLPDVAAANEEMHRCAAIQSEIWSSVTAGSLDPQAKMLLLPALNEMFDISSTRAWVTQIHPPAIIFVMLAALALMCSLLAGIGMASSPRRSWLHMLGFAAIMAVTIYVVIDIEHPRMGMIRVDAVDRALDQVRESMK